MHSSSDINNVVVTCEMFHLNSFQHGPQLVRVVKAWWLDTDNWYHYWNCQLRAPDMQLSFFCNEMGQSVLNVFPHNSQYLIAMHRDLLLLQRDSHSLWHELYLKTRWTLFDYFFNMESTSKSFSHMKNLSSSTRVYVIYWIFLFEKIIINSVFFSFYYIKWFYETWVC